MLYNSFSIFLLLAELQNDHKDITEKINANIQMLHSVRVGAKSSSQDSGLFWVNDVILLMPRYVEYLMVLPFRNSLLSEFIFSILLSISHAFNKFLMMF